MEVLLTTEAYLFNLKMIVAYSCEFFDNGIRCVLISRILNETKNTDKEYFGFKLYTDIAEEFSSYCDSYYIKVIVGNETLPSRGQVK